MALIVGTDSFCSVEEADTYTANRPYAEAWPVLGLLAKENALRLATQMLNELQYRGRIKSEDQTLAWPRYNVYDREGRALSSQLVPNSVKAATFELALVILRDDLTNEAVRRQLYRVTSEQIGQTSATYTQHSGIELPAAVLSLIGPFLESQASRMIRA